MNSVIWKFQLLSTGPSWITMPVGAQICHVGIDPATGLVAFWAIGDPSAITEARQFRIVGTGEEFPRQSVHRGTAIIATLVWHLIEIGQ